MIRFRMPRKRSVFYLLFKFAILAGIRETHQLPVPAWYRGDHKEDLLWL